MRDREVAKCVEEAIETDMRPGNSWDAALDDPDRHVAWRKRSQVRFYQLLPMRAIL